VEVGAEGIQGAAAGAVAVPQTGISFSKKTTPSNARFVASLKPFNLKNNGQRAARRAPAGSGPHISALLLAATFFVSSVCGLKTMGAACAAGAAAAGREP
jgi:hypothetical protein